MGCFKFELWLKVGFKIFEILVGVVGIEKENIILNWNIIF